METYLQRLFSNHLAHGSIYPARLREPSAEEIYRHSRPDLKVFEIQSFQPLEIYSATHETAILTTFLNNVDCSALQNPAPLDTTLDLAALLKLESSQDKAEEEKKPE
ncbi:hypothetical protein GMRT_14296 [Giardia muris]|uniref:Uncharacterized protein n=1 Tax=Giardia muris TaxID=5742 RepID=A0A4Z1T7U2_GIAMU|nr:hypothetical protein GMRT_14296 [Giardia muris]|eukprot:TNJ30163.1 hypothetical protein GMRT_14296 [Giardia muris]